MGWGNHNREKTNRGGIVMKHIPRMSGTKAGAAMHHARSPKAIDAPLSVLRAITRDWTEFGEFVATQGLAEPNEAKVMRGEKDGMSVTDGIFPESKELLWGYWVF
jgi:hypothetical protein